MALTTKLPGPRRPEHDSGIEEQQVVKMLCIHPEKGIHARCWLWGWWWCCAGVGSVASSGAAVTAAVAAAPAIAAAAYNGNAYADE